MRAVANYKARAPIIKMRMVSVADVQANGATSLWDRPRAIVTDDAREVEPAIEVQMPDEKVEIVSTGGSGNRKDAPLEGSRNQIHLLTVA